jgi:hypothetical protein
MKNKQKEWHPATKPLIKKRNSSEMRKIKKINCGPDVIRKNLRRSVYDPPGLKNSITRFEISLL